MRRQMLGKSMLEVPVVAAGCMRIQGMDETEVDENPYLSGTGNSVF